MGRRMGERKMFGAGSLMGALAALAGLAGAVPAAAAEAFPTGVIRIVVPAPTSSPPDLISRLIARELSSNENWRIIVENKPGVGGIVGGSDVLQHPADGLTLFALSTPDAAAPALMSMPFHLSADFSPVIKTAVSCSVLVVSPSVPARPTPTR